MKMRHVAETILALALTPACGADLAGLNGSSPTVATSALQAGLVEEEEEEWDESLGEVQVGAETAHEVRQMYGALKASGALNENEWRLNEDPPERQYAHVALENDVDQGLNDGYETMAWVPVDDAGNVADPKVYMVRVGGVAGWQFVAGPFNLAR